MFWFQLLSFADSLSILMGGEKAASPEDLAGRDAGWELRTGPERLSLWPRLGRLSSPRRRAVLWLAVPWLYWHFDHSRLCRFV